MIQDFPIANAIHLTPSDRVHHFIALQDSLCGLERKEVPHQLGLPFHKAMILLDYVVEVFKMISGYVKPTLEWRLAPRERAFWADENTQSGMPRPWPGI